MDRKEALKINLKKYKTGKPCKNGHESYRYAASGTCKSCIETATVNVRKRKIAMQLHLAHVCFNIHPEDIEIANDFIAAINYARLTKVS